jgi:hypothetical protein
VIEVKHATGEEWLISIHGNTLTRHRVRVSPADLARFGQGQPAELLLRESFQFLLEREPNTSILGSFDLSIIGHYFPEYEQEIRSRLRQAG